MTIKHSDMDYDYFVYNDINKVQIAGPMDKLSAQMFAKHNNMYVVRKRLKPSRRIRHPRF